MLPQKRFSVRAHPGMKIVSLTKSQALAFLAINPNAEYCNQDRQWRSISELQQSSVIEEYPVRTQDPEPFIEALAKVKPIKDSSNTQHAVQSRTSGKGDGLIGYGCLLLILGLAVYIVAGTIYIFNTSNSKFVYYLPDGWRTVANDEGHKVGYLDGVAYGTDNKESPAAMQLDLLAEQRSSILPSNLDKNQWLAGYKSGFEAGFYAAKKKAF